jgi:hypothetical protein
MACAAQARANPNTTIAIVLIIVSSLVSIDRFFNITALDRSFVYGSNALKPRLFSSGLGTGLSSAYFSFEEVLLYFSK